jgi:hypothetical protein
LEANLEKIGCEGLLDFQWGHEEEKWLNEIYNKDMLAFPSTVRANLDLWKEELIAEVFGISKVGMGMPRKVPAVNHALKSFAGKDHSKEGWEIFGVPGCRALGRPEVFDAPVQSHEAGKGNRKDGKHSGRVPLSG